MAVLTSVYAESLVTSTEEAATDSVKVTQPTKKEQKEPRWTKRNQQRFLPSHRRMDREINKVKFAYKGEVTMGLAASYGTLSSDNADILTILSELDAKGTVASVKPSLGYFYADNRCLGVRFGYQYLSGGLGTTFDLGESNSLSGSLAPFNISSNSYSFGIFHRSYAGLDRRGRFGLFAEFEFSVATGTAEDARTVDGVLSPIYSENTRLKLSFNPGAAVYIFPNVCATISFGLGGVQYNTITQHDKDGNELGTRKASKMRFKLNLADINFGINIHLWDKKKQ